MYKWLRASLMLSVALLLLTGCAIKTSPMAAVEVLQGPAPVRSWTPMEDALGCLKQHYPREINLRIGVSDIIDGTGQMFTGDSFSKAMTQRPDMMMVISLSKTGVRQVNRTSVAVAEWELKQAMEKRLGDGERVKIDTKAYDYRPVVAGTLLGSTHYVTGAITELNWNIKSKVAEFGVGGVQVGGRVYYISIAVDLVVTNTLTTEIVIARSYSKQLLGQEISAGLFRFFNVGKIGKIGPYELIEFNLGEKMNEPMQTALRWMFEAAAYDIVADLAGLRETCDQSLPPGTLGNSGPSTGNSDQSIGNSDQSIGNSGPSIGDSGPSTGNSGPSIGNSGPSIGDSGPSTGKSGKSTGKWGEYVEVP
jgi:curli biogenesis system outer membrane secretion channel CsgG